MSNHLYPLLLYSYDFSPTPSITFRFPSSSWKLLSRSLSLYLYLSSFPCLYHISQILNSPFPFNSLVLGLSLSPPPHSHISIFLPLEFFCHQSLLFFYTSSPLLMPLHILYLYLYYALFLGFYFTSASHYHPVFLCILFSCLIFVPSQCLPLVLVLHSIQSLVLRNPRSIREDNCRYLLLY